MELKREQLEKEYKDVLSSNRTFMELKHAEGKEIENENAF